MASTKQKKTPPAKVIRNGNFGVVIKGKRVFSFSIEGVSKFATPSILPLGGGASYELQALRIGKLKIVPSGDTNLFPVELRDALEKNNLTEGVFKRQRGLMWGQGPSLYKEVFADGQKTRTWIEDPEVLTWLESFDYEEQLRRAIVDYYHTEGHYAKLRFNKGVAVRGSGKVMSVEHVGYHKCRLEWPEDLETIKNIIVGNWANPNSLGLKSFPVFDQKKPFAASVAMMYTNMYSFGHDYYGLPAYYGALSWINQGSAIPTILNALAKNSLNIKWHIKSPASYWTTMRERLERQCVDKGENFKEELLEEQKDAVFAQLAEVLAGVDNVGKFFTSEKLNDENGVLQDWTIEPIDQKIKEFVESQVLIAKQADSAITSGMGLHPSLSNIMVDGKLASGSEQLYALKIYLTTEIDIPESLICKPINTALAINYPTKKLKIGFFHEVVKTEDSVSPQDRVKNAV